MEVSITFYFIEDGLVPEKGCVYEKGKVSPEGLRRQSVALGVVMI